jgi:resuscitation-promoting factor RpfA
VKFVLDAKTVSIVGAATFAAVVATSAPATAEPTTPPPPPIPAPLPALPSAAGVPAHTVTNSAADPVVEGVPHLPSPENLPPGTSVAPPTRNQPRLTYLRDLWHAMQTQEVSGGDALLLLTQRPMVADATPPRGMPAGPQAPLPADAALPAAAPPVAP